MKFDIFKKLETMKNMSLKYKILDTALNFNIPFNRRLKFKITHLTPDKVMVDSPAVKSRQNHIKGAHACALATVGEYPAGLILAQNFSLEKYRFILKGLTMDYQKQGRGLLTAVCKNNLNMAKIESSNESWHEMQTDITNSQGDIVAICKTNWQVKAWDQVKSKK